ncbi:hypothetical protein HZA96_05170 [Candidatus Woesearchaeota archaeon]|nr:hypothetical protein [Candidatus Woesearchaeota archaeon]
MDAKPLDLLIVDHEATFAKALELYAQAVGVSVDVVPNARDVAAYLQDLSDEELPKAYLVRLRISYDLGTQTSVAEQIEELIGKNLLVAHPDEMRAPLQIYDSLYRRGVDLTRFYLLTLFYNSDMDGRKLPFNHQDKSTGVTLVDVSHKDSCLYLFSLVDSLCK